MLMIMNHDGIGYLLPRGLALSVSSRTSPRSQYITKLMTSVMMSWGTLADVFGEVHKGHTHTHTLARMHTDMLTESVNSGFPLCCQ